MDSILELELAMVQMAHFPALHSPKAYLLPFQSHSRIDCSASSYSNLATQIHSKAAATKILLPYHYFDTSYSTTTVVASLDYYSSYSFQIQSATTYHQTDCPNLKHLVHDSSQEQDSNLLENHEFF